MTVAAGNIVSDLVKNVAAGAKEMVASAMETGISFDSAMSQVAATMGVAKSSIGDLTEFAKMMGSTTQFTATEAAEGLNYLALAGYTAEQSMATLPSVLNLAAAGGMNLAAASDMVTDVMSALGLEADAQGVNVTRFGDILAKTASSSNTSVSQLGNAMLTIGGTAKGLSGGTVELATALGLLADNGIKASEGGTALRNIVLSLSAPTDKAQNGLAALGISILDATGNMRPLNEIFADFNDRLDGMGEGDKTAILNDIFNKADLAAVNALMSTSVERWDQLSTAVDGADGSMQAMADTMMDNLGGALTYFDSAVDGMRLAIFDSVSSIATDGVRIATDAVSQLTDAFKTGGVSGMLSAGVEIVGSLASSLLTAAPSLISSGTDAAVKLINGVASGLASGIPQVAQKALPMLVSLSESLRKNSGKLVDAGLNLIVQLVKGLANSLPTLIQYAPTIISNLAGVINDNAPKVLKAGVEIIGTLVKGILQAIPTLVANAPKIVKAVADVITAFNWLNLGKTAITALKNGITGMVGSVKSAGSSIRDAVTNGIKELPSKLVAIAKDAVSRIKSAFTGGGWRNIGSEIINGIKNGITGAISGLASKAASAAKSALTAAKNALGIKSPSRRFRDEVGKQIPAGAAEGIERNAALMVNAAQDSAEDMVAAAQNAVRSSYARTGGIMLATGSAAQMAAYAPVFNGGRDDEPSGAKWDDGPEINIKVDCNIDRTKVGEAVIEHIKQRSIAGGGSGLSRYI